MKTITLLPKIALLIVCSLFVFSFASAKTVVSKKETVKQKMTIKIDTTDPTSRSSRSASQPRIPNPRLF